MNLLLFVYLVIFALFGTSATYFARFLYDYWVKKEMHFKYLLRAGICVLLVMIMLAVLALTGN